MLMEHAEFYLSLRCLSCVTIVILEKLSNESSSIELKMKAKAFQKLHEDQTIIVSNCVLEIL